EVVAHHHDLSVGLNACGGGGLAVAAGWAMSIRCVSGQSSRISDRLRERHPTRNLPREPAPPPSSVHGSATCCHCPRTHPHNQFPLFSGFFRFSAMTAPAPPHPPNFRSFLRFSGFRRCHVAPSWTEVQDRSSFGAKSRACKENPSENWSDRHAAPRDMLL